MRSFKFATLLFLAAQPTGGFAFSPSSLKSSQEIKTQRFLSDSIPSDDEAPSAPDSTEAGLEQIKDDLVRCCTRSNKPLLDEVQGLVQELEDVAEQVRGK